MQEPVPPTCCCCIPAKGLVIFLSILGIIGCAIEVVFDRTIETKIIYGISLILELATLVATVKNNALFMRFILWLTAISMTINFITILVVPVFITATLAVGLNGNDMLSGIIPEAAQLPKKSGDRFALSLLVGYSTEAVLAIVFLINGLQYILINRVFNYFTELNRIGTKTGPPV